MTRNEIQDEWPDTVLLFIDPPSMDVAILGVCERFGQEPIVAYDRDKVIELFAKDMGDEEAEEWFYFNTIGAWAGEHTPCFISKPPSGLTS